MNPVFTFILGLLIGWIIEWLIDVFYWRKRYAGLHAQYSGDAADITRSASPDNYDLFKTLVTALFVTILILMLVAGLATNVISLAPAETLSFPNATEILPTSPLPILTSSATKPTNTLDPSPAPPTVASTSTAVSIVMETSTIVPEPATSIPLRNTTCNTSVPSRLHVGQTARVVQGSRMRKDASIAAALIQINPPNTQVEIIGGPVCTPVDKRAYLWWQVRLVDGTEGWSAESQLQEPIYLLEPIP